MRQGDPPSDSLHRFVSWLVKRRPFLHLSLWMLRKLDQRTCHIRSDGMSRIKEQLADYVQGKIQEIAEHSQCTKVGTVTD